MRKFDTGAIRDDDNEKVNYEKGFSPLVFEAYGEFMTRHNKMPDGSRRDEGNWKKGFTPQCYMESKWRHFLTTWTIHDEFRDKEIRDELRLELNREPTDLEFKERYIETLLESLCAEMFNTMGYMHVLLLERRELAELAKKSQKTTLWRKIWNILRKLK